MTTTRTYKDDTSQLTSTVSWSRHIHRECSGMDRDIVEAINVSITELQQLSALSDEGPRAPANSLQSLCSENANIRRSAASTDSRRSTLGTSESSEKHPRAKSDRGERTATEDNSEATLQREEPTGSRASTCSLVFVTAMVIAFVAAFAYAVFLFRMNRIPAPEKKIVASRSTNDTGATSG